MAVVIINCISETLGYLSIDSDSMFIYYNLYFLIHQTLWLYIAVDIFKLKYCRVFIPAGYVAFYIIDKLLIETEGLLYFSFISSSLTYIVVLLIVCFSKLKNEALDFFEHRQFAFVSAPLLFFCSMSFIFAFRDSKLRSEEVFGIGLYEVMSYSGSIVYYTLLMVFAVSFTKLNKSNQ
ncbi:hypothetical protein BST97_08410 [Nonlabens spongiae]|uniref:Uncharacterized protein n=1 Tax=Nonlabens spongiae TaxID=331648 RepID=A0A1W6MKA1_9FLAO|nr:hypothetical protein BST97_08410 [Nonlabens spongiae]